MRFQLHFRFVGHDSQPFLTLLGDWSPLTTSDNINGTIGCVWIASLDKVGPHCQQSFAHHLIFQSVPPFERKEAGLEHQEYLIEMGHLVIVGVHVRSKQPSNQLKWNEL